MLNSVAGHAAQLEVGNISRGSPMADLRIFPQLYHCVSQSKFFCCGKLYNMRFQLSTALTAALGLAASSDALKILMGNDDGFGSGNLRELYKLLIDAGHDGTLLVF